jgi:hypothetical protein
MSAYPLTAAQGQTFSDRRFGPMSDIEQLLKFSQSVQITLKLWGLNEEKKLSKRPNVRLKSANASMA